MKTGKVGGSTRSSNGFGSDTRRRTSVRSRKSKEQGFTIQLLPPSAIAQEADQSSANCPVSFTINAPEAKAVSVAGSFNRWDPHTMALSKGINGEWSTYITLKPGQYEYRFIVDGVWKEDPAAAISLPNPYGERNSVLNVK